MKFKLVKFKNGKYGARNTNWFRLFFGYEHVHKYLILDSEMYDLSVGFYLHRLNKDSIEYIQATRAEVEEALEKFYSAGAYIADQKTKWKEILSDKGSRA